MAPIKFEEDIREQLENRTIKPSIKGWDELANRLDNETNKKSSKRFWLLGIAASFIGVLLIVNSFRLEGNQVRNKVVDTKTNGYEIKSSENLFNSAKNIIELEEIGAGHQDDQIVQKNSESIKSDVVTNTVKVKPNLKIIGHKSSGPKINSDKMAIAQQTLIVNSSVLKTVKKDKSIAFTTIESKEIIESSTVVKVSSQELDALLNQAQKSIVVQNNNDQLYLDYNELLQDVEDSLEETLRDKLFKTVKDGYSSVKSYVAERKE